MSAGRGSGLNILAILGLFLTLLLVGCSSPQKKPAARQPQLEGTLLAVDKTFPPMDRVEEMIAPFRREVDAQMLTVLGHAPKAIVTGRPQGPLGDLVADSIRAGAQASTGLPVDVAFTNAGGIRNVIPAGKVTVGTVFEVMPFDNTIVVFELRGEDLQKLLDSAAGRGGDPVSGASFVISRSSADQVMIGGKPLVPDKVYRVATNDYVFEGGGRFRGLKAAKRVVHTGVLLRDVLIDQVKQICAKNGQLEVKSGKRVSLAGGA